MKRVVDRKNRRKDKGCSLCGGKVKKIKVDGRRMLYECVGCGYLMNQCKCLQLSAQRDGGELIERVIERPPIVRSDRWAV